LESEGLAIGEAATGVLTVVRSCMEPQQIDVTLSKLGLKFDLMISLAEEVSNLEFTAYSPWPATLEELIALMKQSL
jgi:hypothetical protein